MKGCGDSLPALVCRVSQQGCGGREQMEIEVHWPLFQSFTKALGTDLGRRLARKCVIFNVMVIYFLFEMSNLKPFTLLNNSGDPSILTLPVSRCLLKSNPGQRRKSSLTMTELSVCTIKILLPHEVLAEGRFLRSAPKYSPAPDSMDAFVEWTRGCGCMVGAATLGFLSPSCFASAWWSGP